MQLRIRMHLMEDAIFRNGGNISGSEDISVLTDEKGFPYFKGSSLKGIFKEELINYLCWEKKSPEETARTITELTGDADSDFVINPRKLIFSDLTLHPVVTETVLQEEDITEQEILEMFTDIRAFTGLENGLVKVGSLRFARCIKKDLNFYGTCTCCEEDREVTEQILKSIKWVGSMRSRGFGKVEMEVWEADA